MTNGYTYGDRDVISSCHKCQLFQRHDVGKLWEMLIIVHHFLSNIVIMWTFS